MKRDITTVRYVMIDREKIEKKRGRGLGLIF